MIPLVSVVMPAYNHEQYIEQTINSVLSQDYGNLELVIVDDGSTDKTAHVIHSFSDKRIKYHYQKNQDAYNALNTGISLAKGDYISIINSDDVYTPERLKVCIHEMQTDSLSCVFTDIIPIDDNGIEFKDPSFGWNQWHRKNRDVFLSSLDLYKGFLHGNFMVTTSNLVMTRECVDKVGNFNPIRYLHDYDYIFRILQMYPAATRYISDKKLLKYRIHSGNTLGEAAILGREQDQKLIRRSLMAVLPQDKITYANTAIDRLIELDNELRHARKEVDSQNHSIPESETSIIKKIIKKILDNG